MLKAAGLISALKESTRIGRCIMTSRKRWSILGAAPLLVIGAVSVLMAQTPGTGRGASPMYDAKTETTIKGTVESVEAVTGTGGRGRRGLGGTHITVKTEKETLEVHVGPTALPDREGDHACERRHARDSRVASNDRQGTCRDREADQERRSTSVSDGDCEKSPSRLPRGARAIAVRYPITWHNSSRPPLEGQSE